MTKTKFIPDENAEAIGRLLMIARDSFCGGLFFEVWDSEEMVIRSANIDEVLEAIDGGDEEITIHFVYSAKAKERFGWVAIMPYEELDCIPYNYSDTEFCNKVIEKFNLS